MLGEHGNVALVIDGEAIELKEASE